MPWYRIVHFAIMALALLAGVTRFRELSLSSRYLLSLLVVTILNEAVSYYLTSVINSNLITSYFFIPLQYLLISKVFEVELVRWRNVIKISMVVFFVFGCIVAGINSHQLLNVYPSLLRTTSNILIILLCLLWLRELMNIDQSAMFVHFPLFWISTGFLLFCTITLFNFSAFNFINSSGEEFNILFRYIRIGANFFLYILFFIAFIGKQLSLPITKNGR